MRLTALSEVEALDGFRSEHGLSFWIEFNGSKILFDSGASQLFRSNADLLGIDPDVADIAILSHGHFDHGDGLPYLKSMKLLCHPGCFVKRFRKGRTGNIGIALTEKEIRARFDLHCTSEPLQFMPGMWFLGEIPRTNDFEATSTPYVLENGQDDWLTDDSGLAFMTEHGLVIVSGCAHSGICNMTAHAIRVTGVGRVHAVIGGFHLRENEERTTRTIQFLKDLRVERVIASHCTTGPALREFRKVFGGALLAGQQILL